MRYGRVEAGHNAKRPPTAGHLCNNLASAIENNFRGGVVRPPQRLGKLRFDSRMFSTKPLICNNYQLPARH
jgi:hypothetical protein